ncbi:MAG TPA: DUF4446 family protein [Patescibacteria group bacterium]|nr:DUF4446 family protein [Patescibacteria group bacterium]
MFTYIIGIIILWLLVISYVLWTTRSHYNTLIAKTKKGTIGDILSMLIKKDEMCAKQREELKNQLLPLLEREKLYYQKIGFHRFNAFERSGGEQSFIIALLNKEDTGIIMNFLYTRDGMRMYAKKMHKGISEEYELSHEEKETIKKAQ